MRGYLLDTNHMGQAVSRRPEVRSQIQQLRAEGRRVGTCVPVLCELEAGIQQVQHPAEYRADLVSAGRAAALASLDRLSFLARLASIKVPAINLLEEEVDAEVQAARELAG